MKKFINYVFIFLNIIFIMHGCGEDSKTEDSSGESVYLHTYSQNNGVVTEIDTGVKWQQSGGWDTMSWDDAKEYCDDLVFGGIDNWELPEKGLLIALFERDAYDWHSYDDPPYINNIFDCRPDAYWTNTKSFENYYYYVRFDDKPNTVSMISGVDSRENQYYARCVSLPY